VPRETPAAVATNPVAAALCRGEARHCQQPGSATISILVLASMLEESEYNGAARETMGTLLFQGKRGMGTGDVGERGARLLSAR